MAIDIALATKESVMCGASRATHQGFSNHTFFFIAEVITLESNMVASNVALVASADLGKAFLFRNLQIRSAEGISILPLQQLSLA